MASLEKIEDAAFPAGTEKIPDGATVAAAMQQSIARDKKIAAKEIAEQAVACYQRNSGLATKLEIFLGYAYEVFTGLAYKYHQHADVKDEASRILRQQNWIITWPQSGAGYITLTPVANTAPLPPPQSPSNSTEPQMRWWRKPLR